MISNGEYNYIKNICVNSNIDTNSDEKYNDEQIVDLNLNFEMKKMNFLSKIVQKLMKLLMSGQVIFSM